MKCFFISTLILFFCLHANCQTIGIGTNNPSPSSIVDITDTTKGFLIPRLTYNKRIGIINPVEGLLVYQTDSTKGIWFFKGGKWKNELVPKGNNNGDILYWNGFQWAFLPAGDYGKPLGYCDGMLVWGSCLASVNTSLISVGELNGTATIGGEVAINGGTKVVRSGICWSTNPNPTIEESNHTNDGATLGLFNSTITVSGNTIYYVRAYAQNAAGIAYGNELSFKTKSFISGRYLLNFSNFHPSLNPNYDGSSTEVQMIPTGLNKCKIYWPITGMFANPAILNGGLQYFANQEPEYTIDPVTNKVTVQNAFAGAVTFYTMNPNYNSYYDPITKNMYAKWGYRYVNGQFDPTTSREWTQEFIYLGP
jgi:hypothetical protein